MRETVSPGSRARWSWRGTGGRAGQQGRTVEIDHDQGARQVASTPQAARASSKFLPTTWPRRLHEDRDEGVKTESLEADDLLRDSLLGCRGRW